jgi:flavodoxin/Pyruvate/2-oxoacid:ferredoxin oxidoreductase delta subunit
MMKILILYFSGTGNTEFVSRYIKEHLISDAYETTLAPIELFNKESIAQYDSLFFGFPVYACNMPRFVQDYLQEIPITAARTVFIFCTKAFFAGTAIKRASQIFQERGYTTVGYADLKMPGSDGLAFLKKDSQTVSKMINKDFSKLNEIDEMINRSKDIMEICGRGSINQYAVDIKPAVINFLASKLLEAVYETIEGRLKKKFWADENCIGCLKCEKICPVKNIEVNEKGVLFRDHCLLCMRCLHQCPKEAIQIGQKTVGKFRWKGPLGNYEPIRLIETVK